MSRTPPPRPATRAPATDDARERPRGSAANAIHYCRHACRTGAAGIVSALAVKGVRRHTVDSDVRVRENPNAAMIGCNPGRPHMVTLLNGYFIRRHIANRLTHFFSRFGRISPRQ